MCVLGKEKYLHIASQQSESQSGHHANIYISRLNKLIMTHATPLQYYKNKNDKKSYIFMSSTSEWSRSLIGRHFILRSIFGINLRSFLPSGIDPIVDQVLPCNITVLLVIWLLLPCLLNPLYSKPLILEFNFVSRYRGLNQLKGWSWPNMVYYCSEWYKCKLLRGYLLIWLTLPIIHELICLVANSFDMPCIEYHQHFLINDDNSMEVNNHWC